MFEMIQADGVPAQPWRNGGGRTRELLTRPADTRDWRLRISLAEIDRAGPFSSFPGIQRWFAVIAGAGVELSIEARKHVLRPGDAAIHFIGEQPVSCRLLAGTTADLNLMHAGGTGCMQLAQPGVAWRSSLPHRGLFTAGGGCWQADGSVPVWLPPRCLLWLDEAGAADWTFRAQPAQGQTAAPAFWLGFDAEN